MNRINIFIIFCLMAIILIGGFYAWNNNQNQEQIIKQQQEMIKEYQLQKQLTEKQYQACLEKCRIATEGFYSMFKICEAECKEKYGK